MKLILIIMMIFTTSSLFATANQLGAGIMLGNPTGLNAKYWLDDDKAIDGGLAFSFGKHTDFSIHSDYLLHKKSAFFFNDVHPLDLYYGLGGRFEFADNLELGLRVPVGVAHRFSDRPIDVFGEVAPILDFIGTTGMELHLAVGARYYF
jgi:hypothetical protein